MNSKKFIALITAAVLVIGSMSAAYGDSPFGDIENNWAKANIISVYEKGLMNGTSEGKFSPNSPVSKYSAVITIARMMNAEKTEDLDTYIGKYKDILDKYSVPSYARREVAFCLDKEIIQGEIDLVRFNEEPNATKLDICIYLGRAFGIKHDPSQPSAQLFFRDTEMIPRAYRIYVDHMIKIEVVDGKGDANGDFRPNDPLTRAMFAKMIDVANTEYTNEFGQGSETSPSVEDENEEEPSKEITDKIDYISDTATSTIAKGTIDSIIYSRSSKPKILLEVEGKKIMEFFMPEDLIKENVIIEGRLSDVYSLRPGMHVEVKAQNGVINNIATVEITKQVDCRAVIRDIDLIDATMMVNMMDTGEQIMKENKVYLKGAKIVDSYINTISIDELQPGLEITLIGIEETEGIKAITIMVHK